MKVISFTCLHYGLDYLEWAIRSVIDHVDEHWVVYSPVGSHGFRTDRVCPDTREELYAAAQRGAGDKLRWHEGTYAHEGEHRGMVHQLAPDADVILVVDADEVWAEGLAEQFTAPGAFIMTRDTVQRWRLPIIHYWRSFYRCVLYDPAFPVRVIYPKAASGEDTISTFPFTMINHFGYAQRPEIVEYKQHTHGHKGEWRKDVDWFNDVFMANRQTDTHPVGSEYWNPEQVNPWYYLPHFMRQHPYANSQVIE